MAINWNLDADHSELNFSVKHMMIATVSGRFSKFTANFETEGEDITSARVKAEVDTSSVTTGSAQRDGHVRGADFFDVENHPKMIFESTKIEKKGSNYLMHGNLTIRNISKPIVLDVEAGGMGKDPWGNMRVGFSIAGKIKRTDWNLVWNVPLEGGGILVSDDVKIFGDVQFVKA